MFPGYTSLFKKVLYPAYNGLIGRNSAAVAGDRIQTQSLPREELEAIQLRKLKGVLINAAENVPFYRRRFKEIGFDPRNLASLDEFNRLPFYVTKADVKAHTEEFIAEGCDRRKLTWHRTGGSTGEPLLFATDPATDSSSAAAIIQALSWWGIELGERHAMFWGSPQFIIRQPIDHLKKYINVARNVLMNRYFVSNYNLSKKNIPSIRKRIESFKPVYVRGMPSSLYVFARELLEQGKPLSKGRPMLVHSACEQLFDWQREVIERGFSATVANTYGLSELADIAYGAPCGHMHILEEDVLIELSEFGSDGQGREIVATQLNNMMTPLIKYRTADIAVELRECDCGLTLRTLEGVKGRAHDLIVAPDGRFLHGQIFTHLLVFEPGVDTYQIRQIARDSLKISLVTTPDYSSDTELRVRKAIKEYMGGEVVVEFVYVEKIPLTQAGKHRWIISELPEIRNLSS